MTQTEELVNFALIEELVEMKDLVVYNDHINTFDYVIETLVKVCKHNPLQAEQCTTIIHFKGKCQVKRGQNKEMIEMCTALLNRGITAEVE